MITIWTDQFPDPCMVLNQGRVPHDVMLSVMLSVDMCVYEEITLFQKTVA